MATSTISNTITGPSGTVVSGAPVIATLMPTAGFRISGATEVARMVSTTTDGSGAWSLALERNSNITPANTYYEIQEYIPVSQGGRRVWRIQVGASNQTVSAALITPIPTVTTSNFLTQASADARYQALSAIGTDTPTTIDPDDAASAGVSTAASRGDHQHAITAGTPVATGDANAEGAGTGFARDTHVHKGVVSADAWTSYTPTFANLTVGNGTLTAAWVRLGRTIHYYIKFVLGTTSSMGSSPTYTLPVAAAARYSSATLDQIGVVLILDSGTANFGGISMWVTSTTAALQVFNTAGTYSTVNGVTAAVPMVWTTSDGFTVRGEYEAAS